MDRRLHVVFSEKFCFAPYVTTLMIHRPQEHQREFYDLADHLVKILQWFTGRVLSNPSTPSSVHWKRTL